MAQISNNTFSKSEVAMPTGFHLLSARFTDPLDCLAAHLLFESSEVLAGIKPANLVSLVNRPRSCGRNLYELWHSHHNEIASRSGELCFEVLQTKDRSLLLFCYNAEHLEQHLSHPGIRAILAKAGYDIRRNSHDLLSELRSRIESSDTFPHEIGLFIGYPAKDVVAFMGMVSLPFACQGPWKIYGEARQSLTLADDFRRSRHEMGRQLASCDSPFECLNQTSISHAFYRHRTDNDFHHHSSTHGKMKVNGTLYPA